ncbi:hypothetical protein BBJ28_00013475 [Nothophytophthora sp. Chile5]|nr:hypothetical protein BBJ28_00013475 [Nothophytophthora sp. Chile5]
MTPSTTLRALSALLLIGSASADTASTTYPGRCMTTTDCNTTYGSNYACVSVDASVAGLEQMSMCIPGAQVCSGRISGLCPTFMSWPAKYRVLQPVCAFVEVKNCDEQYNVTVTDSAGSNGTVNDVSDITISSVNGSGTVQCYSRNFTANDESVVVNGIYQCIDEAKYVASNGGHIQNITDTVMKQCGWNTTTKTLCNGQGTCSPLVAFAQDYECKCNAGYNASDFCYAATSNACSSVSQCGTEGTCALSNGTTTSSCACQAGATGNQCLLCDATASSSVVCNGHGTCGSNGVCTCSSGYNGTFCGDAITSTGSSSGSKSSSTTTPSSGSIVMLGVSSVAATLLAAIFAL